MYINIIHYNNATWYTKNTTTINILYAITILIPLIKKLSFINYLLCAEHWVLNTLV